MWQAEHPFDKVGVQKYLISLVSTITETCLYFFYSNYILYLTVEAAKRGLEGKNAFEPGGQIVDIHENPEKMAGPSVLGTFIILIFNKTFFLN